MKRKQVLFTDEEKELLNHALERGNFSDYVKMLIRCDKEDKIVKDDKKPSIYEIYNDGVAGPLLSGKVKKIK